MQQWKKVINSVTSFFRKEHYAIRFTELINVSDVSIVKVTYVNH